MYRADVLAGPGSFLEAIKLIPLLTKGDKDQSAFHLVVPSLPNFGFSEGVKKVYHPVDIYTPHC